MEEVKGGDGGKGWWLGVNGRSAARCGMAYGMTGRYGRYGAMSGF